MLPVRRANELNDVTQESRDIRSSDQSPSTSSRNDDSSATCESSSDKSSDTGASFNSSESSNNNNQWSVRQESFQDDNNDKQSSRSQVDRETSVPVDSVTTTSSSGASSATSNVICPSNQLTDEREQVIATDSTDTCPLACSSVTCDTTSLKQQGQPQQQKQQQQQVASSNESSSLSHSSSSDSSSRRTLLPSIKLSGGTGLIGSSSSSPSSVSSQQLDGFMSTSRSGTAVSPVTVSVTEVSIDEDSCNRDVMTSIISSYGRASSSSSKISSVDKFTSVSSSQCVRCPSAPTSVIASSSRAPSNASSHDTPRGYSIKGEHYKNRFKGHIPEIECDKVSVTSPSESQETHSKGFTRSHQLEKSRFRPATGSGASAGDSSYVTTGHSSTRRGPVKHCASEPEVDSQSINAAISAAAAESVIPSAYHRARKKFAEIKSATQGDRRSSTASSYNRPGKVSPSKRTETEKSENRTNRGRQRRRRSLSLCESFSDGESTDGSFTDKVSKKWSLPVPSTTSRGSRGSESTETSYTSRSSAEVESLSGGEISPSEHRGSVTPGTEREDSPGDEGTVVACESGAGSSGATASRSKGHRSKHRWSKASHTHSFVKIYSYVFERCRNCDTYIYLSGFKCEKCHIFSHSKCLRSSIIICGQKPLPRKLSPIFGVPLDSFDKVPYIVIKCCQEIEKRGYAVKGIYRVNGHTARIRKLVRAMELGPSLVNISDSHVNDLTNVLKEYFRSLPDPLFMSSLYRPFINTAKNFHNWSESERRARYSEIVDALVSVVNRMSPQHKATLQFLMHHLRFISDNKQINQMSSRNLGLVFAPSLFRIKDPEGQPLMEDLFDNSFQALIIELLIDYCMEVFGDPVPIPEEKFTYA